MDGLTERLLRDTFHRGCIAEVDEGNRREADCLLGLGYADVWRTLLGREAIRLTDLGRNEVRRIESAGRRG